MENPLPGEITKALRDLRKGDIDAESRLASLVYDELHRLAKIHMAKERQGHTLQATALVNEAYIQLIEQRQKTWQNRAHFFAVGALLMRRILVDYARAHVAQKRGGDKQKVTLEDVLLAQSVQWDEILAIDQALSRLAEWDPRQSRVVELRFFGGLREDEIAEVLGIGVRTVKRDWNMARAWLRGEVGGTGS